MTGDPLPEKRLVLLELLKVAWVYVHLDPRREGVVLPEFLREQPRLVLQYGYNMPVPMHDLTIDERASLPRCRSGARRMRRSSRGLRSSP